MNELKNAIVLAGGAGTRLRPMTESFPKPLARVANVALIEMIVRQLKTNGIAKIAMALGYQAEKIKAFCGDGSRFGLQISYVVENTLLGSGGAIANVLAHFPEYSQSPFLVANADVPSTGDFRAAFALHQTHNAEATIVCGRTENIDGLGLVEIAEDGRVRAFHEKPQEGTTSSRWANLAFWIFQPQVFQSVSPREYSRVEDTLFAQLLQNGAPVFAHRHQGFWLDVGTLPRYLQAQRAALDGTLPVPGMPPISSEYSAAGAPSLLRSGCEMGEDVQLSYAVLGDEVRVGNGVVLENVVVYDGASIGQNAKLCNVVIGPQQRIEAHETLHDVMRF